MCVSDLYACLTYMRVYGVLYVGVVVAPWQVHQEPQQTHDESTQQKIPLVESENTGRWSLVF